jgi:hypothetical protein
VHPDHPLRVKGESGLRVYIGTSDLLRRNYALVDRDLVLGAMNDGEQRLLMKTEQADYIRQWLYSVGLSQTMLPLPGSEFVLTESTFPFITQELFDDANMFKVTQKVCLTFLPYREHADLLRPSKNTTSGSDILT